MKKIIPLVIAAVAVSCFTAFAPPPPQASGHGTDILHFFIRKAMANEGVEPAATGRVEVKQNRQGKANNQTLTIAVRGLDTNATYQVLALIDDDAGTNLTHVADFAPDAKGKAALQYVKKGNGNGNGGGLGRGKSPLPGALDPVSLIRSITIFNASTQAVLTADITDPDKLQYLVKRNLGSGDVSAQLRIKATTAQTQFRLMSAGLAPSQDYLLVLNGEIAETNTSNDAGKLDIRSLASNPLAILDLRSVALWDTASNVVVSTELP